MVVSRSAFFESGRDLLRAPIVLKSRTERAVGWVQPQVSEPSVINVPPVLGGSKTQNQKYKATAILRVSPPLHPFHTPSTGPSPYFSLWSTSHAHVPTLMALPTFPRPPERSSQSLSWSSSTSGRWRCQELSSCLVHRRIWWTDSMELSHRVVKACRHYPRVALVLLSCCSNLVFMVASGAKTRLTRLSLMCFETPNLAFIMPLPRSAQETSEARTILPEEFGSLS